MRLSLKEEISSFPTALNSHIFGGPPVVSSASGGGESRILYPLVLPSRETQSLGLWGPFSSSLLTAGCSPEPRRWRFSSGEVSSTGGQLEIHRWRLCEGHGDARGERAVVERGGARKRPFARLLGGYVTLWGKKRKKRERSWQARGSQPPTWCTRPLMYLLWWHEVGPITPTRRRRRRHHLGDRLLLLLLLLVASSTTSSASSNPQSLTASCSDWKCSSRRRSEDAIGV